MRLIPSGPGRRPYPATIAIVVLLGALIVAVTAPRFGGDENDYVDSAAIAIEGVAPAVPTLVEPGHLLWRPTLYALTRAESAVRGASAGPPAPRATRWGKIVAAASVTVGAAALATVVLGTFGSVPLAVAAAACLWGIHGVLNYAHLGLAYAPALGSLCGALALSVAAPRRDSAVMAAGAGLLAALAVLFWLPLVLVLPAVFVTPWLLSGAPSTRARTAAVWIVGTCAAAGVVAYGGAAALSGVSPSEFPAWVQSASHSIVGSGGVARVVVGLARSFVYLGDDPAVVRRYLGGDPFFPVTTRELATLTIWPKLALFYGLVAVAAVVMLRSARTRPTAALLACAAVPCVGFGLLWQGGDVERYLPLYPFAVIAASAAIASARSRGAWAALAAGLVAIGAINVAAFSRPAVDAERRRLMRQTACDEPMPARSLLVLPTWRDPLLMLFRTTRYGGLFPDSTAVIGGAAPATPDADRWRGNVAERLLQWDSAGGTAWIAEQALAERPTRANRWVEGEDPRLRWRDIPAFFRTLSVEDVCDNADGFVRLRLDDRTRRVLTATAPAKATAAATAKSAGR